jgi:hypothetical protein
MARFFDSEIFPLTETTPDGHERFLIYQPIRNGSRTVTYDRFWGDLVLPIFDTKLLNSLDGVNTSGVQDKNILIYNSTSTDWEPSTTLTMEGLTDTTITTPITGDRLVWDAVTSKWIHGQNFIIGYFGETDGEMTTLKSTYPADYVYDTRNGDAWLGGVLSGSRTLYTDHLPHTILYTEDFDKSYLLEDGKNTPFVII